MTALSSVLTSSRYDLRDTDSTQYTDAELVEYANRARVQLDAALGSLDSDWVSTTDTLTLAASGNSVSVPSDFSTDRFIWYSTNKLRKKSVDYIIHEQQSSQTGRPYYYAVNGANIIFERTADQEYSFTIQYNKQESAWTTDSTLPYSDEFNDSIKKMIVLQAKQRNELPQDIDTVMYNFFRNSAMSKVIRRKYVPKKYRLDF